MDGRKIQCGNISGSAQLQIFTYALLLISESAGFVTRFESQRVRGRAVGLIRRTESRSGNVCVRADAC